MEYEVKTQGRTAIVVLTGDVDLYYTPHARRAILKCLDGQHDVLVDLSAVSYIDSSGVASLVEGFQTARNLKVDFGLVGVSDKALGVLKLARLDKVFTIHAALPDTSSGNR